MNKIKIYDAIKRLLEDDKDLRDSDRKLIWAVWEVQGLAKKQYITRDDFLLAESSETIRRTRQKLQETNTGLTSSQSVQRAKNNKAASKGTFIYRERAVVFDEQTRTASFV